MYIDVKRWYDDCRHNYVRCMYSKDHPLTHLQSLNNRNGQQDNNMTTNK